MGCNDFRRPSLKLEADGVAGYLESLGKRSRECRGNVVFRGEEDDFTFPIARLFECAAHASLLFVPGEKTFANQS